MTPNTRKPTKKQVSDTDLCWWWKQHGNSRHGAWENRDGLTVRQFFIPGDRWLPYSAIPDPNNTTKEQTT